MAKTQQSGTSDIVITAEILAARNSLNRAQMTVKKAAKSMKKDMDGFSRAQQGVYKAQENLDKALGKTKFQGWAMSIMFAGMAIKNTMSQIWSSSQKTFNEVMHSTAGTVTGFDMLEGSLKYLGFTMGQVLEPLAYALIPIIDYVQQLISNNPDTTRGIFKLLTILGTASAAGGAIWLAKAGFSELAGIISGLTGMKVGLPGLMAGTVAIYYAYEEAANAYDAFKSSKTAEGMLSALSAGFMAAGGIALITGGAALGGSLFAVGMALKLVNEDKFFQTLVGLTAIIGATFNASWDWAMSGLDILMKKLQRAYELGKAAALAARLDLKGAAAAKAEADKLKLEIQVLKDKSFGDFWKDSYKDAMDGAKIIDASIKEWKSAIDSATQVSFQGDSLGTQGITQLISQAFGALSAPGLFKNDQFQKDVRAGIGTVNMNISQNKGENELDFANRVVLMLAQELGLNIKNYQLR